MKKIIFSIVGMITAGLCHGQVVFINELHYDNAGGDTDELIEVAGPAGTDLDGWTVALYNGGNGQVYRTIELNGTIADMQAGYGVLAFAEPGIQNGPDGLALVDPNDAVIQFLSYEGVFTATDGPATGLNSSDIGVAESNATPLGHSLQLIGAGTTYSDFSWNEPAPGSAGSINPGQDFSVVGNPPQITCPIDIEVVTDIDLCQAMVEFDNATATDPEDGTLAVTQTMGPASGSLFPLGQTVIEFSATDSDDNTVFCQFTITVTDAQEPVLNCPADQTVFADLNGLYEVPDYWALGLVSGMDNCAAQLSQNTQNPPPGELIPAGVYDVDLMAEDDYGNSGHCSFKLTVHSKLSVSDPEQNRSVWFYPNPVKQTLTLLPIRGLLTIYDAIGQIVLQTYLPGLKAAKQIEVSYLPSGTYFAQLRTDKRQLVGRFVKE